MAPTTSINLALQGGGAHGAFTWGVLDRILEDDRVEIAAISGTSAGAMNAAAVADGLTQGGREAARERLADFWTGISRMAGLGPWLRGPVELMTGSWNLDMSPAYWALDAARRTLSPYQFNPMDVNPIRDILADQIDFERVRGCDRLQLFVSATNVRTGRIRVFDRAELTPDTVMASAALPQVYQAVEIDGEAYWDGGFMGNPAIFPLIYESDCPDIVIVQINPIAREDVPTTPHEIANRMNEISFNASLLRELRAISFVTDLVDRGELDAGKHKRIFLHRVPPASAMLEYGASSKFNPEFAFLAHLRDLGRAAAGHWLDQTADKLGRQSTIDFQV
jgi:NTE family protein